MAASIEHPEAQGRRLVGGGSGGMIRLMFLIRSLNRGGAERQLIELVKALDKSRFTVTVVTFLDGGDLRPELEGLPNVEVHSLRKKGRWDLLPFLVRLCQLTRRIRPQIIHSYMSAANEFGLVAAKLCGTRCVWGLRASKLESHNYDWTVALLSNIGAGLSRFVDMVIANSHAGLRDHLLVGYRCREMIVIPNGIDAACFQPDRLAGAALRAKWGIAPEEQAIGMAARLDPMKDHQTFFRAAALLVKDRSDVRFVCLGGGPKRYEDQLRALVDQLGLKERVVWAGPCRDMKAAYNALDIATSCSSFGEGFSNALAEAMACGVPCVTTDVGDSALIVGDPDLIVPAHAPVALKAAWQRVLHLPSEARAALGRAARERVVQEFGTDRLARRTETALGGLLT